MRKSIVLRGYNPEDYDEILRLFYDTVHFVNAVDYSENQLNVWAPVNVDAGKWKNRLASDYTVVVEKENVIIGFGTLKDGKHFDLLYVHKDYQRIGTATLIADDIENRARNYKTKAVTADSSITARPFFEKRGYKIVKNNEVLVNGQILLNYKMEKFL